MMKTWLIVTTKKAKLQDFVTWIDISIRHCLQLCLSLIYTASDRHSSPKSFLKPPSTPEKPMKARLKRPAVTSTMDIPRIPFGMLTIANCSRIPAKTTNATANPTAVEKAYTTL